MNSKLSNNIKAEALRLGFYSCGIARAEPVDATTMLRMKDWLDSDGYADMKYMADNTAKRLDPTLLMEGAKSIVCVAMSYAPAQRMPEEEYQLATYAYGKDYHDVMKEKLTQLASIFGFHNKLTSEGDTDGIYYRALCDTAPMLERYWATKAGLGWIGRNHQLTISKAGSMFFLGELLLDVELNYDQPATNHCGTCHACIDACPTHALCEDGTFNAKQCLSYLTIENRGEIDASMAKKMGHTIYGCDECLRACPHNRMATATTIPELQPKPELLAMTKEKWNNLTETEYQKLFKGSAVKRAKYSGLKRNITAVKQNQE